MDNIYLKTKMRMVIMFILILGGLNYGGMALGHDFINTLSNNLNNLFKMNFSFNKIIYLLIAVCAIFLTIQRTTWLPFLGKTVLPDVLIPLKTPEKSDLVLTINTKPNTKIAYWSTLPNKDNNDVEDAYGDYSNSGVVMSDENGVAKLPILSGSSYKVPSGKTIKKHLHYRELGQQYGMINGVKTLYY
jgi:uncharacterized membrane protein YuzA (DUF378 family)